MGHGLFWRILRRFCGGGFGDIRGRDDKNGSPQLTVVKNG